MKDTLRPSFSSTTALKNKHLLFPVTLLVGFNIMAQRTLPDQLKLLIKKSLTRLLQFVFLKQAVDATETLPDGPLLVIAPHPDDETLGCAAIMRRYKTENRHVRIIIVTDGSHADLPGAPSPQDVAATRRKESIEAARLLGIPAEDILFLDYTDGQAAQSKERIADDIASQIWIYQPALIIGPHGIDSTSDHRAVADAVHSLQKNGKITCTVFEYPLWFWPKGALTHLFSTRLRKTHRKVRAKEFLPEKKQAIAAHACQKHEANWDQLEAYAIADNLHAYELFFDVTTEKE